MTRQKKELTRKIDRITQGMELDADFGYFSESDWGQFYEELARLNAELARLKHYASVEDMLHDDRDFIGTPLHDGGITWVKTPKGWMGVPAA